MQSGLYAEGQSRPVGTDLDEAIDKEIVRLNAIGDDSYRRKVQWATAKAILPKVDAVARPLVREALQRMLSSR